MSDISYSLSGPLTPGSASSGGLSTNQFLGAGALGLGALGLGTVLARGEQPIPQQFQQLEATVPQLQAMAGTYGGQSQQLFGEGQQFLGQGQQALGTAAAGELTAPQAAALDLTRRGLDNTARQIYASMGRDPAHDTSFIETQEGIDQQTTALAQAYIQSTIQLGLGEVSAGQSLTGQAGQFGQLQLGAMSQASQALIAAGNAQLAQDKAYGDSLNAAFGAVGSLVGGLSKLMFPGG